MKYIWWLVIIYTYLITLLIYAIISHLYFDKDKERLSGIDAIFFGITSVITISLMPIIKQSTGE